MFGTLTAEPTEFVGYDTLKSDSVVVSQRSLPGYFRSMGEMPYLRRMFLNAEILPARRRS